jgi:DNA-binding response OmpR family regulator
MANILVVDDDKVLLKVLQATLVKAGHSVLTVEDARTALEKLENEMFDLIIADINMPGGASGFNLISTVRKNPKLKDLPAIFLSGRRDKSDIIKALEAGIDDYIVKPFDTDMLYAKIESLLEKKAGKYAFADCPVKAKGSLPLEFEITGISEQGITIVSIVPFPINFRLKFDCDLFQDVELENPVMRVAHCSTYPKNPKMYSLKANFIGLTESDLQKVRRWIMANNPRIQKAS